MADAEVKRFVLQNFITRLARNFEGRVVNVEFFCGQCCKKALGGILAVVGKDFIELKGCDGNDIEVLTFGEEGVIDTECVEVIIIPICNVCSVEISS